MDTQAFDVVTFDFKGTGVRCVLRGSSDYQFNCCCFLRITLLSDQSL